MVTRITRLQPLWTSNTPDAHKTEGVKANANAKRIPHLSSDTMKIANPFRTNFENETRSKSKKKKNTYVKGRRVRYRNSEPVPITALQCGSIYNVVCILFQNEYIETCNTYETINYTSGYVFFHNIIIFCILYTFLMIFNLITS